MWMVKTRKGACNAPQFWLVSVDSFPLLLDNFETFEWLDLWLMLIMFMMDYG